MQQLANDTFKQFIPLELIKGKDKNGKEIVKFKSLISTTSQDADGEWLDPSGFNYTQLLRGGAINWNHQSKKSPKASFLGKPTKAYSDEKGGWVEGELYSKLPMVQEVLELQKGLKEYGMTLGVSIEGKATERDEMNPLKVLKADITGLAITPTPKNIDTTFELMKGMELNSLLEGCGDDCDNCNCKVEKSLSAYEDKSEDEQEKAMDTGAVAPLTKESVDEDLKDSETKDSGTLTKGEVLEKVLLSLPNIKGEQALNFYDLLKKGQSDMENNEQKINKSFLEKAMDILGISKPSEKEEDTIEKSIESMTMDERLEAKESLEGVLAELNKACSTDKMEKGDESEEEDEEGEDEDKGEKEDKVEKSVVAETIENDKPNDLIKGIVESIVTEKNDVLQKSIADGFKALGTILLKQVESNDDLTKGLEEVAERLENIENQPQESRGALTTSNYISKGFEGNADLGNEPKRQASKRDIIDTLMKGQESNGFSNQALCDEIAAYETTGRMSPIVAAEAKKAGLL